MGLPKPWLSSGVGMPGDLGRIPSYGESLGQMDCGLWEPGSHLTYGSVDGAVLKLCPSASSGRHRSLGGLIWNMELTVMSTSHKAQTGMFTTK